MQPFRRSRFLPLTVLAALAGPARAHDEVLRGSLRDLNAREKQALADLVTELGKPDPDVRNHAVRQLEAIGRPAIPALGDVLRKGSEPKQLRNACLALGAMDDAAAASLLDKLVATDAVEDVMRAALFALGRPTGRLSPETAESLSKLATESSLFTVRESAILAAGARKLPGLADLLKRPIAREPQARVRGCMLVALADSGDPGAAALVAGFLDGAQNRDEKLRRAALYAAARLGDPALLQPLLKFQPSARELDAWLVALGACADPKCVDALARSLTRDRERAVEATFSLAQIGSESARKVLVRALDGEFSEPVQEAACLAVTELTDRMSFLPSLRKLALAPGSPATSVALLALARIGDEPSSAAIARQLSQHSDPRTIVRGLLCCALDVGTPLPELVPAAWRESVSDVAREVEGVRSGTHAARLLSDRVTSDLRAMRGHWLLRRDDLRSRVVRELLDLDRIVWTNLSIVPGGGSGGSSGSGSGSGGSGSGGGSGGSGSGGSGSGGDGSGSGSGGSGSGGDSGSGSKGGFDGAMGKSRKQDTARFELDLRQWLDDFPIFEVADPYAR